MISLRRNSAHVSVRMVLAALACVFALSGCDRLRQDMATQPKYRPLSPSDFFRDGRSERPLLENTVARGSLANDELMIPRIRTTSRCRYQELLARGKDRYTAFCTPCHGLQGDGKVWSPARHEASSFVSQ